MDGDVPRRFPGRVAYEQATRSWLQSHVLTASSQYTMGQALTLMGQALSGFYTRKRAGL